MFASTWTVWFSTVLMAQYTMYDTQVYNLLQDWIGPYQRSITSQLWIEHQRLTKWIGTPLKNPASWSLWTCVRWACKVDNKYAHFIIRLLVGSVFDFICQFFKPYFLILPNREAVTLSYPRACRPVLHGLERGQAGQLLHPGPQPLGGCLQHRLDTEHKVHWQLHGPGSTLCSGDQFKFQPGGPDCLARQLRGPNLQSCGPKEIWWVVFSCGWICPQVFAILEVRWKHRSTIQCVASGESFVLPKWLCLPSACSHW